jgi:hypothetical protein
MNDVPMTIDIRRHVKDVATHVQRRVRGDLVGVRKDERVGSAAVQVLDVCEDHDLGN